MIPPLFSLYCFVTRSKSFLKSSCQDIVGNFFSHADNAAQVLLTLIVPPTFGKPKFIFAAGASGGVILRTTGEEDQRDYLWEAECAIELMKGNDKLAGNVFVELLSEFIKMKNSASETGER